MRGIYYMLKKNEDIDENIIFQLNMRVIGDVSDVLVLELKKFLIIQK